MFTFNAMKYHLNYICFQKSSAEVSRMRHLAIASSADVVDSNSNNNEASASVDTERPMV